MKYVLYTTTEKSYTSKGQEDITDAKVVQDENIKSFINNLISNSGYFHVDVPYSTFDKYIRDDTSRWVESSILSVYIFNDLFEYSLKVANIGSKNCRIVNGYNPVDIT